MNNLSMYNHTNKQQNLTIFNEMMFNRTVQMFHYENLPDTLPFTELEKLLQLTGKAIIGEYEGSLYCFDGGFSGNDAYGRPTTATVNNPYLQFNKEYKINDDCVVMQNDTNSLGLRWLFSKYGTMLLENDITMILASYNKRVQTIISGDDEVGVLSAKKYLDDIVNGELGVIQTGKFFDGITTNSANSQGTTNYTELIEYTQYLKASLFNELGIDMPFNMKRERLNTSEVEQNSSSLYTLINDMLFNRKNAVEKINDMFGTEITVEFSEPWKVEPENPDEDVSRETIDEDVTDDEPENPDEDVETETPDETPDEDVEPEQPDEDVETEQSDEDVDEDVSRETTDEDEDEEEKKNEV